MGSDNRKFIVAALLLVSFMGYSFSLYSSLPVKAAGISAEVTKGKFTWQKYNCNACHQVYGLGGYLGPDLTNVYSTRGKDYIKAFLNYGTATMPNFHLDAAEVNALLAFLENMDASGTADPKSFTINNDGTIRQ